MDPTTEAETPRPNDGLRAALLEALDLADRAGVAVAWAQASVYGAGRPPHVHLQSRRDHLDDGGPRHFSRADALRLMLRAARQSQIVASGVYDLDGDPWVSLDTVLPSGTRFAVYCAATDEEVAAARDERARWAVGAVLQS